MQFVPRDYQRIAGRFMLTHNRCALWLSCGLGKTSTTLTALQWLIDTKRVKKAIVFAPLRVAKSWPNEADKWGLHIKVVSCCGTPKQRQKALKNFDVVCTNFEQAEWILDQGIMFDAVVIDESSRVKSYRPVSKTRVTKSGQLKSNTGKHSKAIGNLCKTASYVYELTGTPAANHLDDLYGQIALLDGGARLGRSMTAFHERYFIPIRVGKDAFSVRWEPRPNAQKEIESAIADIVCSLKTEDYFPVDKPIYSRVEVSLEGNAKRIYSDMEKEMFAELENGEAVEVFNAGSKLMKCMQIASGFVYADGVSEIHSEKIEALRSIIEETNEPVAVCYWFQADCERLLKAFPGSVALNKNNETLERWNRGEIPVLLLHPASAGHGLNLQDGGRVMVFFSHPWSLELRDQAIERLGPTRQKQSGHERPVYIYDIVARHTVDELVLNRYTTKKSVQDTLLDALRYQKANQ